MKRIQYFGILILLICISSCSNTKNKDILPENNKELSFFLNESNRLLVYTNINGVDSILLMLDNGATRTIINQNIYKQHTIFKESKKINTIKDSFLDEFIVHLNIQMGEYNFTLDTIAQSQNFCSSSSCEYDKKNDVLGIIGVEFFLDKIVQIDFVNKKINISTLLPQNINDYKSYNLISHYVDQKPYYEKYRFLEIPDFYSSDGKKIIGSFLLDLGSPKNMVLNHFSNKIDTSLSKRDTSTLSNKILYLSPTLLNVVNIDHNNKETYPPFTDGYLGVEFLKHFDVIFDYQHNKLYLKPNKYFKT